MDAPDRPRFIQCLQYSAMRLALGTLTALPLGLAAACGRGLAAVLAAADGRHRRRVEEQIRDALGLPEAEAKRTATETYRHFGTMLAEFPRIRSLTQADAERIVDWDGREPELRALLAEGRGILYATGHIGNWEIGGSLMRFRGHCHASLARPLDNPLIDQYVTSVREASGLKVLAKFGVIRAVARRIRDGEGVGFLVDQDAGKQGEFVPFFGRPASTIPTVAELAIRTGAPIVVAGMHRNGRPMRFRIAWGGVLRADPGVERRAERTRLMTEINRLLESVIRQAPAQWLWMHRRWKTRPPGAD